MIESSNSSGGISSYSQVPSGKTPHDSLTSVALNAFSQASSAMPGVKGVANASLITRKHSIELSDVQLNAFAQKLPALAKALNEEKRHPEDRTLSVSEIRHQSLQNGKILHPVEVAALNFYTRDGFRLINGVLNFETSIRRFMEIREISPKRFNEVSEAGRLLYQVLKSALNKLPNTLETTLYRGDTILEDNINNYQVGCVVTQNRFTSVSVSEGTAGTFAMNNASERGGIPALYIIENPQNPKDIDSFSKISGEKERLYLPDQSWEIIRVVDEKTYYTTEINDEDDIKNARERGELIEKVVVKNGKEKTKYYIEDKSDEPQRVLKIYMKEV